MKYLYKKIILLKNNPKKIIMCVFLAGGRNKFQYKTLPVSKTIIMVLNATVEGHWYLGQFTGQECRRLLVYVIYYPCWQIKRHYGISSCVP